MSQHPAPAAPADSPAADGSVSYNARLGLFLFFIYLALYVGFVAIATFRFKTLGVIVVAGVNLAIVYGFGLIVAALLLAIVYMFLCRSEAPTLEAEETK